MKDFLIHITTVFLLLASPKIVISQSCHADFDYVVDNQISSFTYHFRDKSTASTPIISYYWDFGDGYSSGKSEPEHQFLEQGTFLVSLTIMSADSCISTHSDSIEVRTIVPPTCLAYFTFVRLNQSPAYTYAFTDHSVTGNSDTITVWSWDFGDGSVSGIQNPIHQYNSTGNFVVKLDIQTKNGCSSSYSFTVQIFNGNSPCTASFSFLSDSSNTLGIYFHDNSLHATNISSWRWYFDDGDSSVLQDPHHIFPYAGLYEVRLKISTTGGCTDELMIPVKVGNPQPYNLWGRVYAGPYVIDKCIAYLYKEFNNEYFKPADTVRLTSVNDTLGVYYFFQIPEGRYRVKVLLPDNSVFWQDFSPTYYGNKETWKSSSTLQLFQDISMANVNLKALTPLSGHCQLKLNVSVNTPAIRNNGIEVLLYNSQGDLAAYSFTDLQGQATFNDLAPGSYHLIGDITGFDADYLNIFFAQDFDTISNIQLHVNNTAITGIFGKENILTSPWKLYPVPAGQNLWLFHAGHSGYYDLDFIDLQGRVHRSERRFVKNQSPLHLAIGALPEGVYLLRIKGLKDEEQHILKLIKKN